MVSYDTNTETIRFTSEREKGDVMETINCLPVKVYRCSELGDCTNRGTSSWFDTILIPCEDGPVCFDAEKETPLNLFTIDRKCMFVRGKRKIYQFLVPAMVSENEHGRTIVTARPGWWMYGGNIADSSDSRYRDSLYLIRPVHIHDRKE